MEGAILKLEGIGKKFYQRWLFKEINHELSPDSSLALVGSNGSGKSTLLKIIAGQMNPSLGKVSLSISGRPISANEHYRYISWSGPYIEAYLDLSFEEQLELHFQWKKCLLSNASEVLEILNLKSHRNKKLQYYSSGMLQRALVGMALFSDTPILLLDEPTSFMDEKNASLILGLINQYTKGRIFVLASNMFREFGHFEHQIKLN